jgi:hypothetical protein
LLCRGAIAGDVGERFEGRARQEDVGRKAELSQLWRKRAARGPKPYEVGRNSHSIDHELFGKEERRSRFDKVVSTIQLITWSCPQMSVIGIEASGERFFM